MKYFLRLLWDKDESNLTWAFVSTFLLWGSLRTTKDNHQSVGIFFGLTFHRFNPGNMGAMVVTMSATIKKSKIRKWHVSENWRMGPSQACSFCCEHRDALTNWGAILKGRPSQVLHERSPVLWGVSVSLGESWANMKVRENAEITILQLRRAIYCGRWTLNAFASSTYVMQQQVDQESAVADEE